MNKIKSKWINLKFNEKENWNVIENLYEKSLKIEIFRFELYLKWVWRVHLNERTFLLEKEDEERWKRERRGKEERMERNRDGESENIRLRGKNKKNLWIKVRVRERERERRWDKKSNLKTLDTKFEIKMMLIWYYIIYRSIIWSDMIWYDEPVYHIT